MWISGMTTTLEYSNLDTSEQGYYYSRYHATNGSFYEIDFRIVFKVGNPVNGDRVPQEHIHYNYSSTWEDQLLSYGEIDYINGVAQTEVAIQEYTYDNQGNPDTISIFKYTYYNDSTGNYEYYTSSGVATLSWSGRELTKIEIPLTNGDSITIEYKYNDQGYRTEKKVTKDVNSSITIDTIKYELIDDKVVYETDGNYAILYTYDYDGTLISFNYDSDISDQVNGTEYFYVRNQMGDISHIVNSSGIEVVHYVYDAYGNVVNTEIEPGYEEIAERNSYGYRGYRLDRDTNLYYLNSRYYNSEVGRFINADGLLGQTKDILSTNMYNYCANNPIMYVDEDGDFWNIAAGFIIGGIISAVVDVASQYIATGEVDLVQTGIAFLSGGASGALAATGIGLAGSIVANAAIGGVSETASQLASGVSFSELDPIAIAASTVMGGVSGAISGPGMKHASNPLAQADMNLSILRQLNSESPSRVVGDMISNSLSEIGYITTREIGIQTVKSINGSGLAEAVCLFIDYIRG